MTSAHNEHHFSVDGFAHAVRFSHGTVLRVERASETSVHGGGYAVGTSKGVVGRNYVTTTHSNLTKIWLQLDGGKEEFIQVARDIPVREGNTIELMRIDGHYVVRTVGYDARDKPIIEKASNLLTAIRIIESGKCYPCRDLKAAVAYEDYYTSTGRLFLWSLFFMPAMGAGLVIWAWLLLRAVLLRCGSALYGIPEDVSADRWLQITTSFEDVYNQFRDGSLPPMRHGA